MDYRKALETLESARDQNAGKPIANNTRIVKDGDSVAIRLHETNVVVFHPDGRVSLATGGWQTVTTRDRINRYAPCRVSSQKGAWYVSTNGMESAVPFAEGVTIHPDGSITGAGTESAADATRKLRRQIRAYAKDYVAELYAGNIPTPGNGDCWGCLMRGPNGEGVIADGHIEEHIREKYYVPSLVVRALETGSSQAARWDAAYLLKLPGTENYGLRAATLGMQDQIRRAIVKWCERECGI